MSNLAKQVIEKLLEVGAQEFIICPGARNAPFANLISGSDLCYSYFPEERSAAFYALGCARRRNAPVAIITTSGSAVVETYPAAMEGYYTSVPLIIVTADRPKRFRGTGAPQAVMQEDVFGIYTETALDLEEGDEVCLSRWKGRSPLHLNVCLEEPKKTETAVSFRRKGAKAVEDKVLGSPAKLYQFLDEVQKPLVIVSTLGEEDQEAVEKFLAKLNASLYLEATSNLRGRNVAGRVYDPRVEDYDGFLRIGGVPTHRIWRDLEGRRTLSISPNPFSGVPGGDLIHTSLKVFFEEVEVGRSYFAQRESQEELIELLEDEKESEQGLVYALGNVIPEDALVYLGNSLPIREWDLAIESRHKVVASRGVNGIDGQLSTFFGLAEEGRKNVGIIGDLTALYDLAAPWALRAREGLDFAIVIVNNGGGKIFDPMFPNKDIQNCHEISFEGFAKLWGLTYQRFDRSVPKRDQLTGIIEIVPCNVATERFRKRLTILQAAVTGYEKRT